MILLNIDANPKITNRIDIGGGGVQKKARVLHCTKKRRMNVSVGMVNTRLLL